MMYNTGMQVLIALSENAKQSGIVALKMIGAVVAAAILLYLVLLVTRHGGSALEKKKYDKYVEEYKALEHPNLPMLSYEEFVERRAKGEKIKAGLSHIGDKSNAASTESPAPIMQEEPQSMPTQEGQAEEPSQEDQAQEASQQERPTNPSSSPSEEPRSPEDPEQNDQQ